MPSTTGEAGPFALSLTRQNDDALRMHARDLEDLKFVNGFVNETPRNRRDQAELRMTDKTVNVF
jgi:hypothetical protein